MTSPERIPDPSHNLDVQPDVPRHEQRERRHEQPRIYVASLSAYNNGILHGVWIDATQDLDAVHEQVQAMLKKSPDDPMAEEFAIHDYDNFGELRIGEYDSLKWITTVANGIREHGPVFAAWASHCDHDHERLTTFDDAYIGEWKSLTEYAQDMLDDLGLQESIDKAVPEGLQPYVHIDTEAFAHDLELGGDITTVETPTGDVWLFDGRV